MDYPRLFQVTVRLFIAKHDQDPDLRRRPGSPYYNLDTTETTLCAVMQVCWELRDKTGEELIFETKDPHAKERIKDWAQYKKVCQELREKTDPKLKSNLSSPSRGLLHLCNIRHSQRSLR